MGKRKEDAAQYSFDLPPPVQLAPPKPHERTVDDLPEIQIPEGSAWQLVREYWRIAHEWGVDPRVVKHVQDNYSQTQWELWLGVYESTGSITQADEMMALNETD